MNAKLLSLLMLIGLLTLDTQAFYDARQGRWQSRDPIGEEGGKHVYGFARNNAIDNFDFKGMAVVRYLTRRANTIWQRIISNGDAFSEIEVERVSDIYVDHELPRGQNGGFRCPDRIRIFEETCTLDVYLNISLAPNLVAKPRKELKYVYYPHYNAGDVLAGGYDEVSDGSSPLSEAIYAHESGHAWAFLLFTKPCFDEAMKKFAGKKIRASDQAEINRLYQACRSRSLEKNIQLSNDFETAWYRSNGFSVIHDKGYYEFRLH